MSYLKRIVSLACDSHILLCHFVVTGTAAHEYNTELFVRPGLVWIEDIDGVMLFQHIYLTDDLWAKRELPTVSIVCGRVVYMYTVTVFPTVSMLVTDIHILNPGVVI